MKNRIFQQIDQNLLDQHGVHGNHDKFLRKQHPYVRVRNSFFQTEYGFAHHFFHRLQGFVHAGAALADPGHGEQIFHHVQKPVRILPDMPHHLPFFLIRKTFLIFQIGTAGSDDSRQRRAQIMRHCPEQVGAHFLLFRLRQKLFPFRKLAGLFFHMGGCHAAQDGNHHHAEKGDRIAFQHEIELPVWIGEQIVDRTHAEKSRSDSRHIPLSRTGHQQDGQSIKHDHVHGLSGEAVIDIGGDGCDKKDAKGNPDILPCDPAARRIFFHPGNEPGRPKPVPDSPAASRTHLLRSSPHCLCTRIFSISTTYTV